MHHIGSSEQQRRLSEKETLLDAILPEPTHPRSTIRAFSVGVVAIFVLLVLWSAATDPDSAGTKSMDALEAGLEKASHLGSWVFPNKQLPQPSTSSSDDDDVQTAESDEELAQEEDDDDATADAQDVEEDDGVGLEQLRKYTWHKDLEWDVDGPGRLIIVGDVHGMVDAVKELLSELDYTNQTTDQHNDTLVFVGDLVAKHPSIQASLDTVDFIRSLGPTVHAVRGNHDQDVIDFRSYLEASSLLAVSESQGGEEEEPSELSEPPEDAAAPLKHKWRDEHYRIARALPKDSAKWLESLSLTLHIRSLHAYVVHAGLLPWTIPKNSHKHGDVHTLDDDPLMDALEALNISEAQKLLPTSDLSVSSSLSSFEPILGDESAALGQADPELAILTAVKGNRDPYTLLNMRSVTKKGKVSKDNKKGKPWAPIWNTVMKACQDHNKAVQLELQSTADQLAGQSNGRLHGPAAAEDASEEERVRIIKKRQEPIDVTDVNETDAVVNTNDTAPATSDVSLHKTKPTRRALNVVYGHAAARGLDLRQFSIGLDSGAVYGRSLSALVIEGSQASESRSYQINKKNKLRVTPVMFAGRSAAVYSLNTKKP